MQTMLLCLALVLGALLMTAVPSAADHKAVISLEQSAPTAPERSSVDVDLKLGANGFRIGARVFGKDGYTGGAWVNGETRPEGFSVDARVEREGGKSWNFKLNADIDEALRQVMRRWLGGALTDL